jgi:hypothetical protein
LAAELKCLLIRVYWALLSLLFHSHNEVEVSSQYKVQIST